MPMDEIATDQKTQGQNSQITRLPAWREWLPAFAQIRSAAELKLDLAIDGGPQAAAENVTAPMDLPAGSPGHVSADSVLDRVPGTVTDNEMDVAIGTERDAEAAIEPATERDSEVGVGTAVEMSRHGALEPLPATSMRQGMGLVFVIGLVAGFVPFLVNWYTATQAGTVVALARLAPQLTATSALVQDLFPVLTVWLDTAATIGGLDPVGPGWLAAFLSALGNWLSWPLNWLSSWIVYGLGVLVVAKLLGAQTTLQRFYAGAGYAFVPLLLLVFTPIPCVGGLLALIAGIWSLIVYVLAVRVVTGFDMLRSIVSVVAPALIILLIGLIALGAGLFSVLGMLF